MLYHRKNKNIKDNARKFFRDISGITIGSLIAAIGFAHFLIPFKSAPGGAGGLAQIFYYFFNVPPGVFMLIINIPLFIVGVIIFGKSFGFKTFYGIITLSLFTDIFASTYFTSIKILQPFIHKINEQAYSFTNEPLLAVLGGSILLGCGVGIVIKYNGSTGGSDIPALLLRKYFGFSVGIAYLIIDSIIITVVGIIFVNANLILWGLLSLYVSSKVTDFVIEGISYTKSVFIISEKSDVIRDYILTVMDRGCTIINGTGGFTNLPKQVIYIAIHQRELSGLKENVKLIDKDCFMVVNDAYEAHGEGFKKWDR